MKTKTVSIRELHAATGHFVREARNSTFVITDRGRRAAILRRFNESELPGRPFPARASSDLPKVTVDSTFVISEDRDDK